MGEVDTAYRRALDYLNSFIDYEKGMPHAYSPVSFNLARTARLLAGLGQPQERYPSLLIAGTKGKGSTAAFLESILRAAGRRTGLYISPHLHTWRERVQVDRCPIAKADVVSWIARLRPLVEAMRAGEQGPPTYYEISTALALGYFAAEEVDVAVLEVGLGGRLDATNVVTPRVAVITTIGYDHMEILGNTLTAIAGEKAGIVKPAGWVVSAAQDAEAMAAIEAACRERGARLWVAAEEGVRPVLPEDGAGLDYPVRPEGPALGLRGSFQQSNARVAQGVILALRAQGWDIPTAAIAEGLRRVRWPGRLEVVGTRPGLVLDGAHNVDSARALRQALQAEFSFDRLLLITGFSKGHDVAAFFRELGPAAARVIVTTSRHLRAAGTQSVAEMARQEMRVPVETAESVPLALDRARAWVSPDDLICVCGSLFVVAEAREALGLVEEMD
jgi:dihydrofolate synthase/folylpolyglutamate synthase